MDFKTLEPLAKAVASAGCPVLANILGTVLPFPANLVTKTVLNGIASALGTPADDPQAAADAINAAPDAAAEKLQAIEAQNKTDFDFAKLQVEQNEQAAQGKHDLFMAGWRPAFAWSCVLFVWWQVVCAAFGFPHIIPTVVFGPIWAAFGGMLGLRTVEKWLGVATPAVKIVPKAVKRLLRKSV